MYEVTARLKVRDGELEGFKRQAAEMMRLAREKDTKTLRYDWFLSEDGTECEVREAYVDADALVEHAQHVGEARDELRRRSPHDLLRSTVAGAGRGDEGDPAGCRGGEPVHVLPGSRSPRARGLAPALPTAPDEPRRG